MRAVWRSEGDLPWPGFARLLGPFSSCGMSVVNADAAPFAFSALESGFVILPLLPLRVDSKLY